MTTATHITLARLALLPVFLTCVAGYGPEREGMRHAAFLLFTVAALTDMIDGYVARRYRQISRLGKRLDPLADKLLVNLGFVFVAANSHFEPGVPLWAPPLFLARDVYIVLGAYIINERYGAVKVMPRRAGKITTLLQMTAMAAILLSWKMAYPLLGGALAASVWSAADYTVAGYNQILEKRQH